MCQVSACYSLCQVIVSTFFQVPCFMGKSLLAWAFALHKHAAVWAPIIQAPHTGALITHAL